MTILVPLLIASCGVGWILAWYFHSMYDLQKWRADELKKLHADELKKLHADALKHWDETRQALRLALFPAAIKSTEKEFKS